MIGLGLGLFEGQLFQNIQIIIAKYFIGKKTYLVSACAHFALKSLNTN